MKLTLEDIEKCVDSETVFTLGNKTTVVLLILKNGYEVLGVSACVDPANYDIEIGKKISRQRALDKVWELEGYVLQNSHPA